LRQSLPQSESPNGTYKQNSMKQCPDPDHCLIFPISVLGVIIFNILASILKLYRKYSYALLMVEIDTEPDRDRQGPGEDHDPDPAK
jgi:hypothetical protein